MKDRAARAKILARLARIRAGNFGDCRSVSSGVWELRINFGPGYRVYYGHVERNKVLLLGGGSKASQADDIVLAQERWQHFSGGRTKKMRKKERARREVETVDYRERLLARLKNPKEAASYINAAFEEKDMPEVLLIALRDVAEANGISKVARKAGINRVSIYKALSKQGNPGLDTLQKILNAVGLKVSILAA